MSHASPLCFILFIIFFIFPVQSHGSINHVLSKLLAFPSVSTIVGAAAHRLPAVTVSNSDNGFHVVLALATSPCATP